MPARNYVELVEKTVQVLAALSEGSSTLGEVSSRTRLAKSTAFRVLFTLRELGWVEQAGRNGAYRLTFRMLAVARQGVAEPALPHVARPYLTRLRDAVNESAWLGEVRGAAVVLVDVVEAPQKLRLSLDIGDGCPLHASAIGKAVAAHMTPGELDAALGEGPFERYTANTLTTRGELNAALAGVREQGYAANDEETIPGAFVAGAPVFDSSGRAVAAISISTPTVRCAAARRQEIIEGVIKAAGELSAELQALGFRSLKAFWKAEAPAAPAPGAAKAKAAHTSRLGG